MFSSRVVGDAKNLKARTEHLVNKNKWYIKDVHTVIPPARHHILSFIFTNLIFRHCF